jgi:hypothetical protein
LSGPIKNSLRSASARWRTIRYLPNFQKSSPRSLYLYDQRTKWVHFTKVQSIRSQHFPCYAACGLTQPPKRSGSNPGLRDGWYQLSSSEFEACWLVGTGLISLALNPVPVEEHPVASTTMTPSATANNFAFLMCSKMPEQRSLSNLPLLEGRTALTMC